MNLGHHFLAVAFIAWGLGRLTAGCGATIPPQVVSTAAEGTYLQEQLDCVDRYASKQEIDGCRDNVKARWSRKDAGHD